MTSPMRASGAREARNPSVIGALRCAGCGGAVTAVEEGRCAWCRLRDRGNSGPLYAHTGRGNCDCGCGCRDTPADVAPRPDLLEWIREQREAA